MRIRSMKTLQLVGSVALLVAVSHPTTHAQGGASSALPAGQGRDLISTTCAQCHSLQPILNQRDGLAGWKNIVEEMILRGAELTPQESETAVAYLFSNLGPGKPMQTGPLPPKTPLAASPTLTTSASITLPSGTGQDLVQARCIVCHDLGRVVSLRRSKENWNSIVKNMLERGSQKVTTEQLQSMVSYLTAHFGE
jgi:mono/diheme cytochrome c family protein